MERQRIRYMFEHKLLPHWFFTEKEKFALMLLNDDSLLFNLINDIFLNEGMDNPYSAEDFNVSTTKIMDDVYMIRMGFPEPEFELSCYCAYLFFDESFEKVSYFCIEKGSEESDGRPFICSWSPDEVHSNYGKCSLENFDDLIKCTDIHMEQKYGLKVKEK